MKTSTLKMERSDLMPNWCQGSLRIKGKYEDVLGFVKNGINSYEHDPKTLQPVLREKSKWLTINEDGDDCTDIVLHDTNQWLYIEETARAFVDDNQEYLYIYIRNIPEENTKLGFLAMGIKQAWGLNLNDWCQISSKYNLELKLFCIESGMGFYEDIHIKDGKVIKNGGYACKLGHYEDFVWNCPFPWMGG